MEDPVLDIALPRLDGPVVGVFTTFSASAFDRGLLAGGVLPDGVLADGVFADGD